MDNNQIMIQGIPVEEVFEKYKSLYEVKEKDLIDLIEARDELWNYSSSFSNTTKYKHTVSISIYSVEEICLDKFNLDVIFVTQKVSALIDNCTHEDVVVISTLTEFMNGTRPGIYINTGKKYIFSKFAARSG